MRTRAYSSRGRGCALAPLYPSRNGLSGFVVAQSLHQPFGGAVRIDGTCLHLRNRGVDVGLEVMHRGVDQRFAQRLAQLFAEARAAACAPDLGVFRPSVMPVERIEESR